MGSFPLPGHLSWALKGTNTGVVTYRSEHTGLGRAEDGAKGTEVDVSAGSDFGLTSTGQRTACHPGRPGNRGLRRLQCPSLRWGAMLWAPCYDVLCQGHRAPAKVPE